MQAESLNPLKHLSTQIHTRAPEHTAPEWVETSSMWTKNITVLDPRGEM